MVNVQYIPLVKGSPRRVSVGRVKCKIRFTCALYSVLTAELMLMRD
jgi:hypothetical protein